MQVHRLLLLHLSKGLYRNHQHSRLHLSQDYHRGHLHRKQAMGAHRDFSLLDSVCLNLVLSLCQDHPQVYLQDSNQRHADQNPNILKEGLGYVDDCKFEGDMSSIALLAYHPKPGPNTCRSISAYSGVSQH